MSTPTAAQGTGAEFGKSRVTVRVAKREQRSPGDGVGAPTWEVLENRLDKHLSGIVQAEWILPLGTRVRGPSLIPGIFKCLWKHCQCIQILVQIQK